MRMMKLISQQRYASADTSVGGTIEHANNAVIPAPMAISCLRKKYVPSP